MYEKYSRQALPSKEYRELLGSAICVFNSNNSFVIENILNQYEGDEYDWYSLIGRTSGELAQPLKENITKSSNTKISIQFYKVVEMRNRIIHSFQVTYNNEQILATKTKNGEQLIITKEYLYEFIKENEILSSLLHDFRGH